MEEKLSGSAGVEKSQCHVWRAWVLGLNTTPSWFINARAWRFSRGGGFEEVPAEARSATRSWGPWASAGAGSALGIAPPEPLPGTRSRWPVPPCRRVLGRPEDHVSSGRAKVLLASETSATGFFWYRFCSLSGVLESLDQRLSNANYSKILFF